MLIRLLIKNKSNSQVTLPVINDYHGLLHSFKTINYNTSKDEFLKVLPSLENLIKKGVIEIQVNLDDTPSVNSVLSFLEQNSKVIFGNLELPEIMKSSSDAFKVENDLIKIYGVVRSYLIKLSIQQIRNTVAEAGCDFNFEHKKDWIDVGDFQSCVEWPDVEKNNVMTKDESSDLNESDIISIIQSWFGHRDARLNTQVIWYDQVDKELKIPIGSAEKYIQLAASKWNYSVENKGKSTILFKENPRPDSSTRIFRL